MAIKWVFKQISETIKDIKKAFTDADWGAIGRSILLGIKAGMRAAAGDVLGSIGELVGGIKNTFTTKAEIHSPSRLFAREAENIPAGAAEGIRRGSGKVQKATEDMVPTPGIRLGGMGGGGGGNTINVTINLNGGGEKAAETLTSPSFKAQFTKMLEEAAVQAGLRPQGAT